MPQYMSMLLLAALSCSVHAAEVYDLGQEPPSPSLPTSVGTGNQPVYITNTAAEEGTGDVAESMTVGPGASLHIGYNQDAVAAGDITVGITGSMLVSGSVQVGRADTATKISLDMTESLIINGGAMDIYAATTDVTTDVTVTKGISVVNGSLSLRGSGAEDGGTAAITGERLSVSGGEVYIGPSGSVTTTLGSVPGYSVTIGQGGRLVVNGGAPAAAQPGDPGDPGVPGVPGDPGDPGDPTSIASLNVNEGGDGIHIGAYGILATGSAGGMIVGRGGATDTEPAGAGQRLVVDRLGTIDASQGSLSISGLDAHIAGTYMAGYSAATNSINALTNTDAAIVVEQSGTIALSKQLQQALNRMEYHSADDSTIMSASAIRFVSGLPVIRSAMGDYFLAMDTPGGDGMESVWVRRVENGVTGSGAAADRNVFAGNLQRVWDNKFLSPSFAGAVYAVSASQSPAVATDAAGALTTEVFDAFLSGPGTVVGGHGVADAGLMEFYIGGSQYGPAAIAISTATELGHAMYSRINQVAGDYYQFGGIASPTAYASYDPGEVYSRRFWAGGFGRREEAELDHGIAGFKYEPAGMVLGYDALCGPFVLGGALAYGKGDYLDKAASGNDSTITSYSAGLYGGIHYANGLIATGHASYTHMDNEFADYRGGMQHTADYSTDVWSLGARVAYETHPAERLTLTPSIGLSRTEAGAGSHSERLNRLGVMRIDELTRRSTMMPLDLALSWDVFCSGASLFRLGANLGYAYEFDNDGLVGDMEYAGLSGVAPLSVAGREPGRNRFNAGVGFLYSGSKFDLTGRYDYYRQTSHDSHQVKGALGVKF